MCTLTMGSSSFKVNSSKMSKSGNGMQRKSSTWWSAWAHSWAALRLMIAAYMNCCIHDIKVSPSLTLWIDNKATQRLHNFVNHIVSPSNAEKYNEIDLTLAHRDLHFGQMLVETCESGKDQVVITVILDWEFSQIAPFPLWRRSFLWNANYEQPRIECARDKSSAQQCEGSKNQKSQEWECSAQSEEIEMPRARSDVECL